MADLTPDSFPREYDRPPVYRRPVGGIVAVVQKVSQGQTQLQAIQSGR